MYGYERVSIRMDLRPIDGVMIDWAGDTKDANNDRATTTPNYQPTDSYRILSRLDLRGECVYVYIRVCVYICVCFDPPPNVFRVSQRERLEGVGGG